MKKLLSFLAVTVFVVGIAVAQTTPAKKSEKKETKTEMKADTTKKATPHHHTEAKKTETKKK